MKRIISIFLVATMIFGGLSITSGAKTTYNAKWTLTAAIGNTSYDSDDTITVSPGQTVNVTLSFSNDYYIGATCAQIFYTSKLFSGISPATFNKNGRLYQICGASNSSCVDWNNLAEGAKKLGWPNYDATKLAEYKNTHHFLRVVMTPNVSITTTTIRSVNENLLTIPFKVSSSAINGSTGEISIPIETMRSASNHGGFLYCAIYSTSDMLGTSVVYSSDQTFDCSRAILKFRVSDSSSSNGDVNGDGKVNSSDALLVLQHSVGYISLSSKQKKAADVNGDGKINSSDALKILQISTGAI